jgi:hypothetical protein
MTSNVRSRDRTSSKSGSRWGVNLALIGLLVPVAGGRWGSYISVPGAPVYLADVLVACGLISLLLVFLRRGKGDLPFRSVPLPLTIGSTILLLVLTTSLLTASWANPALVIRDAVPIAYLVLTPLLYQVVAIAGPRRMLRWLRYACVIHTLWFTLAVFRLLPPLSVGPISEVAIFTTRGDFDLLISALAVAVFAIDSSMRPGFRFSLIVLAAISLFAGGSRAGLIAGLALLLVAFFFARRDPHRVQPSIVIAGAFGVAALVPVAVYLLSSPPSWMRAIGRLFDTGSSAQVSAQNTWNARLFAWQRMTDYTLLDPSRAWWGSGLGSQPVRDSGALAYLSGNEAVRAAHNFVVTWFAFFGTVGILCILAVILWWLIFSMRSAAKAPGLAGLGFALAVAIVLAGLGGVIIESPFGYMCLILGVAIATQSSQETPVYSWHHRKAA